MPKLSVNWPTVVAEKRPIKIPNETPNLREQDQQKRLCADRTATIKIGLDVSTFYYFLCSMLAL